MQFSSSQQRPARKWVYGAAIVIVAVLLAFLVWIIVGRMSSGVKSDTYQMVQLTNGEVYFGKMSLDSSEYVTLEDAYTQADAQEESRDITIVRLSATIAKPDDTIHIARDQVVHWSNLQSDSKVMDAIDAQ